MYREQVHMRHLMIHQELWDPNANNYFFWGQAIDIDSLKYGVRNIIFQYTLKLLTVFKMSLL